MERKEQEVAEEYLSSLADLNLNSKPLINMLTILAEENIEYAPVIVKAVEQHISKVNPDVKLPVLYLIDSIVKNVGRDYITLFSHRIVNIFCGVFEKVNEKIREKMYTLRQTWNDVFTPQKLCALDVKVNCLDPNWPITAKAASKVPVSKPPAIHVNPNFINQSEPLNEMEAKLRDKQRQLLELQKQKLELELAATKQRLEEQEKHLSLQKDTTRPHNLSSVAPIIANTTISNVIQPRPIFNTYRRNITPNNFTGISTSNATKTRVAPVNPTMLNSLRHRDPRLARQQQQQQQLLQKQELHEENRQQQLQTSVISSTSATTIKSSTNSASSNASSEKANLIINQSLDSTSKDSKEFTRKESLYHDPRKSSDKILNEKSSSSTRVSSSSKTSYHGDKERSRSSSGSSSSSNSKKNRESYEKSSDKSPSSRSKSTGRTNSSSGSSSNTKSSSGVSTKTSDKESKNKDKISSSGTNDRKKSKINSPTSCTSADKSPSSSSSTTKQERSPRKSSVDSPKQNTITMENIPLNLPVKFKDIKQSIKSRNYVKRDRNNEKCDSPSRLNEKPQDIDLRGSQIPDKRIKLDDQLTSNNSGNINKSNILADSVTTTSKIKNLEKNLEAVQSNKDVDLRQFQTTTTTTTAVVKVIPVSTKMTSLINKIETIDNEFSLTNTSNIDEKIDKIMMDIDSKKRQFGLTTTNATQIGNKIDEPVAKKPKPEDENIDELFGKEDVDLRSLSGVPPHLSSVVTAATNVMPMTPPPPPIISNENENWAKVKGSKPNKTSPVSSNFDDVRAKFAKATKNQKGDKNKENKKSRFSDVNEDSSDGTDANIRTIISQAQELLVNESINVEQYNTLVRTVIQINETSKLKEAQRRESLQSTSPTKSPKGSLPSSSTDTSQSQNQVQSQSQTSTENDSKRNEEEDTHISSLKAKSKALQKRIPKLPKDTSTAEVKVEQNSILQRLSPPPSSSSNYTDNRNSASTNVKLEKRTSNRQQKESKWPSWDQTGPLHQNQNKMWIPPPLGGIMNRPPFNPKLASHPSMNAVVGSQNRMPLPNPWNNPPLMIFAGTTMQMPPPKIAVPDKAAPVAPITQFCNSVDNPKDDVVRTINIDSVAKEIRIYDEVAIVFMDWDQPREIGFQNGQRRIIIDDQDPITLNINDIYSTVMIGNKPHKIRFGCPSRELYIDNNWYECCFGGPPIAIPIDGKVSIFKIEGPPPQVNIGNLRQDLVVGKINLIIDARILIPVFLDARVQKFELDGKKHTLQFADCLQTVLIDGELLNVEYGGLPRSLYLGGVKYFIRFGTLPNGIVPGKHVVKDMIRTENFSLLPPSLLSSSLEVKPQSVLSSVVTTVPTTVTASVPNVNTAAIISPILPIPSTLTAELPVQKTDEKISSNPIMTAKNELKTENDSINETNNITPTTATITEETKPPQSILPPVANLNIDELFQKLLASGILNQTLSSSASNQDQNAKKQKEQDVIRPIDLSKSETIKSRQAGVVQKLFSGMQCSSCGVRFPPEQTMKYSQHLDWHFRQNRRERDSSRKAHSRKWYYDVSDWVQYEEIEDIDEREKNWFESQQSELDNSDDNSNQRTNSPSPSCPAGPDDVDRACDMCHDKFEQFYNEESEEWHLKSAIRVYDKIYHPLCYQDYKASLTFDETSVSVIEGAENDNAVDAVVIKEEKDDSIEKSDIVIEDEDDDVIVLPSEEPMITEIPSDDDDEEYATNKTSPTDKVIDDKSKKSPGSPTTENNETRKEDGDGTSLSTDENNQDSVESDVEIQEPHIPFTDLDTYEETPAITSNIDESSQSSQFNLVKVKEEPKDSDNEDDAFEDVGTFVSIDEISQSVDEYIPQTMSSQTSDNLVASIDGNVEIQDTQTTTNIGVNKIRINITKNTAASSAAPINSSITTLSTSTTSNTKNNAITTTTSSLSADVEKPRHIPVIGGGSVIPVIRNFNKEVSSPPNFNKNTKDDKHISSLSEDNNKLTSSSSKSKLDNKTDRNNDNNTTNKKDNSSKSGGDDDDSSIQYELKPELRGIELKKMSKVKSGLETSGLCSIM